MRRRNANQSHQMGLGCGATQPGHAHSMSNSGLKARSKEVHQAAWQPREFTHRRQHAAHSARCFSTPPADRVLSAAHQRMHRMRLFSRHKPCLRPSCLIALLCAHKGGGGGGGANSTRSASLPGRERFQRALEQFKIWRSPRNTALILVQQHRGPLLFPAACVFLFFFFFSRSRGDNFPPELFDEMLFDVSACFSGTSMVL